MTVTLIYNVPIHVEVDMETESVNSVQVQASEIKLALEESAEAQADHVDHHVVKMAAEIAEEAAWPVWDHCG